MQQGTLKNIFITGCGGFLGGSLAQYLLKNGFAVKGSSRKNSQQLSKELNIEVQSCDHLYDVPEMKNIDCLIHCATPNDIISRENDGGYPLAVNAVKRLLEAVTDQQVGKVILLSTVQVYGGDLVGNIDEMTDVCCNNHYALNHFFSEEIARLAAKVNNIDITCVRLSNVFGLPVTSSVSRSSLVPFCFIDELLSQGKITLRSSGLQTRNFVHTEMVASSIEKILGQFPDAFKIFNLGSSWHPSILEVAKLCVEVAAQDFDLSSHISVKSPLPSKSNDFSLSGNCYSPSLAPQEIKSIMRSTIKSLIMLGLR